MMVKLIGEIKVGNGVVKGYTAPLSEPEKYPELKIDGGKFGSVEDIAIPDETGKILVGEIKVPNGVFRAYKFDLFVHPERYPKVKIDGGKFGIETSPAVKPGLYEKAKSFVSNYFK